MADSDERDRSEGTPADDATPSPSEGSARAEPVEGQAATELTPDELVEDRPALDRATERVSEPEPERDDAVEEPTDAELAALLRPSGGDAEQADEANDDEAAEGSDERARRDEEGELVGVGAPARPAGPARGTARKDEAKKGAEKKGKATRKRDTATTAKRTGPVTFVRESAAELRKVVYPTGPQLVNYFVVVLIFVLFVIAVVSLLDLAFGWVILRIFG